MAKLKHKYLYMVQYRVVKVLLLMSVIVFYPQKIQKQRKQFCSYNLINNIKREIQNKNKHQFSNFIIYSEPFPDLLVVTLYEQIQYPVFELYY